MKALLKANLKNQMKEGGTLLMSVIYVILIIYQAPV